MKTVNAIFQMVYDDDGEHCHPNCPAFREMAQHCGPDILDCHFLWNDKNGQANGRGIQCLPTRGAECLKAEEEGRLIS